MKNLINRVGEQRRAKNGLMMTLIVYRSHRDVDVQFEDGFINQHKTYDNFKLGQIGHPNIAYLANSRIGEVSRASNGMLLTLIEYHNASDITVKFEDGTVVHHRDYDGFKSGSIAHPTDRPEAKRAMRLGEVRKSTHGQEMTIVAYRARNDLDVKFEDGTVVCHRSYDSFCKGQITNPNYSREKELIGISKTANNGLAMTLIAYRKSYDIDVQFEDGTVVTNTTYTAFCKGAIRHPNYSSQIHKAKTLHLGETITAKNGMIMTIIDYRGWGDIDVQFEDGYIAKHRTYDNFLSGDVANPNCTEARKNSYVGQQVRAKNGLMMTLQIYRSSVDVDVQFEDGYLAEHKQYAAFLAGEILNPNVQHANGKMDLAKQREGLSKLLNCGITATISKYYRATDIDIEFDSGYSTKHKTFSDFKLGNISHPFPWVVGNMSMDKPAYIVGNTGNFYCHCPKCNLEDIMSLQEMRGHVCQ